MADRVQVKDIMVPIERYPLIDSGARLKDALAILKACRKESDVNQGRESPTTLFVRDAGGKLVGKLSMYDLVRGLVPEPSKTEEVSRAYESVLSSRAQDVAREVGEIVEHFAWFEHPFEQLVAQEAEKEVGTMMSPLRALLREEDPINEALYILFRENLRQIQVLRQGRIVGNVDLNAVFSRLLDTVP